MNLVNKQDCMRHLLELGNDLFQPLFKIAAIARACEQRAHVERINHRFIQNFGHVTFDDFTRQTLGDCGLTHARITDIKRIILAPAAEDLDGAVNFRTAADKRIDFAVFCLGIEVDGKLVERGFLLVAALGAFLVSGSVFQARLRRGIKLLPAFAYAVTYKTDCIEPAHILLLEEIDRI